MEAANGVRIAATELGQAVFAACRFEAEESIGRVEGMQIDDPEYGSDYCIDLGEGLSLEPGEPFRFLNHSCQPNCELVVVDPEDSDSGQPEVWLESRRAIEPGEELTIDYAWPAEAAIPCLCGSERCREWIVAEEELARVRRAVRLRNRERAGKPRPHAERLRVRTGV